jgi:secreted trypsin-like serine protease
VKSTLLVVGLALGTIHCSELGESPHPAVLKGHIDKSDDAVVLMTSGSMNCTGTVIAPTYVLTAAHCVAAAGDPRTHSIRAGGVKVARVHTPSGAIEQVESDVFQNDLAVLELAQPISVTPIPINFDASVADGVDSVRAIGYGVTGTYKQDNGVRRDGTARVTHSSQFLATVPGTGGICYGDSGGPALANVGGSEVIVGVTSYVSQHECERGRGVFVRTDRHRDFLAQFTGETSAPPKQNAAPPPIARRDPPPERPEEQQEQSRDERPRWRHHHQRWYEPAPEMMPPPMMEEQQQQLTVVIDADGRVLVYGLD